MGAVEHTQANRRTLTRLGLVAVAMFGFGYALVPLYNVICEITGLNGKTGRVSAQAVAAGRVDQERWVTVELTGNVMSGLPWDFRPKRPSVRVHPGEPVTVSYLAHNRSTQPVVGQAVPSVTPAVAARYFNKTECFCFTRQRLEPGETRGMPVTFIVDRALPPDVSTVTLSYAFFNADRAGRKVAAAE